MTIQSILAELRANPDKIFHLLRENDFERAKELFGEEFMYTGDYTSDDLKIIKRSYKFHMQQLILAPDVLGYLEEYGKEGE